MCAIRMEGVGRWEEGKREGGGGGGGGAGGGGSEGGRMREARDRFIKCSIAG